MKCIALTMASSRKLSRNRSEESDKHRPILSALFCPEILEHIGRKVDLLAAVGLWNSVLAKRYHG